MWGFFPKRANFTSAHRPEFVLDTDWLFRVAGLVRWTWEARLSRLGRRPGEKERSQANPGDFTADYRRHKG